MSAVAHEPLVKRSVDDIASKLFEAGGIYVDVKCSAVPQP